MLVTDRLLRGDAAPLLRHRLTVLLIAGATYGAAMGTFGGITPARLIQMTYSAAKVPLLLGATFSLSLPAFFVLNTLLGLRPDFPRALAALAGAQPRGSGVLPVVRVILGAQCLQS